MTRRECLEMAMGCVLQDRASQYGGVEDNFRTIANFWSVYLGRKVYPADVAAMMALLKIARAKANPKHGDNWVDLAGYAACGAECANVELYPWQKEVMGTAAPGLAPQAEGCEALAQDAPEFSPGDEVEALSFDGKRWEKVVVDRTEILAGMRHYTVRLASGERHCLPAGSVRRPARAEGCEDLVEKDAPLCGERCEEFIPGLGTCESCRHAREQDAPQTPDELCQRIVDCNPATFRPRTPTGEELAEMAREDAHG